MNDPRRPVDDEQHRFEQRYASSHAEMLLAAEREVLGSDHGANGYTTAAQARRLGRMLRLGRADRLLDLGAGCGWPGLLLAAEHGCRVVGLEPAHTGGLAAVARARRDGLVGRHAAVTARADHLPFRATTFDAIVHTDVLC